VSGFVHEAYVFWSIADMPGIGGSADTDLRLQGSPRKTVLDPERARESNSDRTVPTWDNAARPRCIDGRVSLTDERG